jgi:hypothetical protein
MKSLKLCQMVQIFAVDRFRKMEMKLDEKIKIIK